LNYFQNGHAILREGAESAKQRSLLCILGISPRSCTSFAAAR
jgi:hypothetical protein